MNYKYRGRIITSLSIIYDPQFICQDLLEEIII